jgi:hypothetical protein
MRDCGPQARVLENDPENDPIEVVMARASGPDFDRECGREELNLHGLSAHRVLNPTRLPVPPRPLRFQG